MNAFSKILKEERAKNRILLRILGEKTGLSVGYISDLEQGRRQPPTDQAVLANLEKALDIRDERLVKAAQAQRQILPPEIVSNFFQRPNVQAAFFRLSEMTDKEIEQFLEDQKK